MSVADLALRITVAFSAAGLVGCGSVPDGSLRTNVIVISLDTLRADRLNGYGYRNRVVSPNLDALARDGLLFENHISASPWTTPAHMSLFTSLRPSAHGVTSSFDDLVRRLDGGAEVDRLAGTHVTLAEVLRRHGRATAAFTGGLTLDPRIGFERGFESYDTSMFKLNERRLTMLESWINAHRQIPFFLFWHTFEVHAPYLDTSFLPEVLPSEQAARLASSLAELARQIEAGGDQQVWRGGPRAERRLEHEGAFNATICSALYDGGVRAADAWVGRFLSVLKRAGLYDRTLIVVTSDHGEQLGEAPGERGGRARDGRFFNAHGHTLYEEMIRVPLIVKLPGQRRAGTRVAHLSRTIDVMPTILDVLGIQDATRLQGASLRPLWQGRVVEDRLGLSESLATARESKSLRGVRYKYIQAAGAERPAGQGRAVMPSRAEHAELYDLVRDPGELHDLLAQPTPERLRTARMLEAELRARVAERPGQSVRALLPPETLEGLKALGYVE